MSWDSYLDNLVAQTKDAAGTAHADKACIIGIDGGAKWTTDGHGCALQVRSRMCLVVLSTVQVSTFSGLLIIPPHLFTNTDYPN